jgi:hypothetical protein
MQKALYSILYSISKHPKAFYEKKAKKIEDYPSVHPQETQEDWIGLLPL